MVIDVTVTGHQVDSAASDTVCAHIIAAVVGVVSERDVVCRYALRNALESEHPGVNVIEAAGHFELNADGNYVYAPTKFVATIGVKDIVVVETEDAILVTTREHAQDVGKVVKFLSDKKLHALV